MFWLLHIAGSGDVMMVEGALGAMWPGEVMMVERALGAMWPGSLQAT